MTMITEYDWESDTYTNGTSHTNGTAPAPTTGASAYDATLDDLYSWVAPPTPPAAPCPEAGLSITLRGTLNGIEALVTARGQSPAEFKRNLEAIKGLLDEPQTPKAPVPTQGVDVCPLHHVPMQENHKDGRRWKSHRTAEGWCKGR